MGTSERCRWNGAAPAGGRSLQFKRVKVSLVLPGGSGKDWGGRDLVLRQLEAGSDLGPLMHQSLGGWTSRSALKGGGLAQSRSLRTSAEQV